jgi:hypothetical protein
LTLFLLFLFGSAVAQAPLQQGWSAGVAQYHLEGLVDTPRTFVHQGVDNLEARAIRHLLSADTTCSATPTGKKWSVDCVLQRVSIQGASLAGEEAALGMILADYERRLKGQTVHLKVHSDGRILALDIKGLEKTDKRSGVILSTLNLLMRRLFAPLDLQLPKKGVEQAKPWKQRGHPMALELMSHTGTAGGSRIEHRLVTAGGEIRILSEGRGVVSPGDALEAGTGAMMKMETQATGVWSSERGLLAWRRIETSARYTVSSYSSAAGGVDYRHTGWAALVGEDGQLLGPD